MSVTTKISIADGMSPALRQMFDGINNLIGGLRNLEDEKGRAFDTQELESTAAAMQRLVVGAKVYEQQLSKTKTTVNNVNWNSIGAVETFDTSGINRTRDELEAANDAYARLAANQQLLGERSLTMNILSPEAISDINLVDNKIAQLRTKMALLDTEQSKIGRFNISGANVFSAKAEDIRRKMARIEAIQDDINAAMDTSDIQRINSGYRELNNLVDDVDRSIKTTTASQANFNSNLSSGMNKARDIASSLRTAAAFALTAFSGKKITESTDEYTDTTSRLGLLTESEEELNALRAQIYKSSLDSRSVLNDSVSNVAKLGLLAGDAFGSNAEIVSFDSLMSKAFKVSGASQQERSAGMYQLTQAMAAGKLQGDEFRSIMENAPLLAQAIADYTGKTKGQLKEMSAEGTITADIIKAALFSAADDINAKFETMPKTFGDVANKMKNSVTLYFSPLLKQINNDLNSDFANETITEFGSGIAWAADCAEDMYIWIKRICEDNKDGLYTLSTAIMSVGSAFLSSGGYGESIIGNILSTLTSPSFIKSIGIVGKQIGTTALMFTNLVNQMAPALPLITSVYLGFKMYQTIQGVLSPISTGIANIVNNLSTMGTGIEAVTAKQKIFNAVCNANVYIGIASAIMSATTALYAFNEGQKAIANTSSMAAQVEALSSANATLGASAYAEEHGIDLATAQTIMQQNEEYDRQIEALKSQKEKYYNDNIFPSIATDTDGDGVIDGDINVNDALASNEEWRKRMAEYDASIAEIEALKMESENEYLTKYLEMQKLMDEMNSGSIDIEDVTGGSGDEVQKVEVVNTVDIASEDLRYMRDMAEQEAINQFTSKLVQPQITVTFGDVHETADVDAIINKLTTQIVEDYNTDSDFVHY